MNEPSGGECGEDSGERDGWPARKITQLSTHRFEAQSLFLWCCRKSDSYFIAPTPLPRMTEAHVDLVDQIKQSLESLPADSAKPEHTGDKPLLNFEVVMGLAVRPYNEVDRTADRLLEKIPCTCEFHWD
jgi:hypothetical protein